MKVKFNKSKGNRIKKGTYKCEINGLKRRIPMFDSLTIVSDHDYRWCDELNKWCPREELKHVNSYSSHKEGIFSLKSALRHVKKHEELPKGVVLKLSSNFIGYDIKIII